MSTRVSHVRDIALTEERRVPGFKFSTEVFQPGEQFGAWCDFTETMCDLKKVGPEREGFKASAEAYHLGSLQLTCFTLSPMAFSLTDALIRKSSFDHWCISVVTRGSAASISDRSDFQAAAGETVLYSYARPFTGQMKGTDFCGMFFSRDDFWDIAKDLDRMAHRPIKGPLSQVLADFLVSLKLRANQLTLAEGRAVNDAFGHLLRAVVHQTADTFEAAQQPIAAAQFDRARKFISENLRSPLLSAAAVCAAIGMSRRQLYYLFEQHGGVATYIRNRRLAACYTALTRPGDRRLISSIAYEFGFTNLSSFNRQFHNRYGFSPGEARAAWAGGHRPVVRTGASTFVDWLLCAA